MSRIIAALPIGALGLLNCTGPDRVADVVSDSTETVAAGAELRFIQVRELQHTFGNISAIAVGRGWVFVGDDQAARVWVFDSTGQLIDSIGRFGEGPGDLMSVTSLQVGGDAIHVFDQARRRLTSYRWPSREKRVIRTVTFRTRRSPRMAWVASDGSTIVQVASADAAAGSHVPEDSMTTHRVFGDFVTSFSDTLFTVPRDELLVVSTPGFAMAQPAPFARRSILQVGTDDTMFSFWTGEPRIHAYDQAGNRLYELDLPDVAVRPVLEEDYSRLFVDVARSRGHGSARFLEGLVDLVRREGRLSPNWPVGTGFVVDDTDRLWVTLVTSEDQIHAGRIGYGYGPADGRPQRLVMFDPGAYTFRMGRLPARGWIGAVDEDDVYMVVVDSVDVQSVSVFRARN